MRRKARKIPGGRIPARSIFAWAAFIGAVVSVVGTCILLADQLGLAGAVNAVTRFARIQAAWDELCDNPEREAVPLRPLDADHPGFRPLLAVILSHREEYRAENVSQLVYHAGFGFEMGESYFPEEYVAILQHGKDVPDVVATKDHVENWINSKRLTAASTLGFFVILAGFILGAPAILQNAITASNRRRASSQQGKS